LLSSQRIHAAKSRRQGGKEDRRCGDRPDGRGDDDPGEGPRTSRQARITAGATERLQEVLSRTTSETSIVVMTGQLSGLRWVKGIFDLEVPYGEETVVISGRVSADLRAAADAIFDQIVRAELERTIVRSEYARPRRRRTS
jgi:hypothetical protein